jgi:hypothetical protein
MVSNLLTTLLYVHDRTLLFEQEKYVVSSELSFV